jgi:hypothetical protein
VAAAAGRNLWLSLMDGKRENQLLKERAGGSKVCREEKRERVFFLVERERERDQLA